jgi:hypothetical protein
MNELSHYQHSISLSNCGVPTVCKLYMSTVFTQYLRATKYGFNLYFGGLMLDESREWDKLEEEREILLMQRVGQHKKLFILQRRVTRFWFWQL